MNRYASFFIRATKAVTAAAMALVLISGIVTGNNPAAHAEGAAPVAPHNGVSSADAVSGSDGYGRQPAYFTRVASVPANVYIPEFYQQVVNVSGMYIFTMPDSTVHKRIYGALEDNFGWYVPEGPDNVVYADSPTINTADDSKMYYEAVNQAELESLERQEFSGILPPDEFVTEVDQVKGVPVDDLIFYCVAGVVLLCLLITIGATAIRSSASRKEKHR